MQEIQNTSGIREVAAMQEIQNTSGIREVAAMQERRLNDFLKAVIR